MLELSPLRRTEAPLRSKGPLSAQGSRKIRADAPPHRTRTSSRGSCPRRMSENTVCVGVILLLALILLLTRVVKTEEGSCNDTTQIEVRGVCCDKCPPGTFRVAWCDVHSPNRCQPCPEGSYNAEFNTNSECDHCTRCNAGLRQVMKEDCTPTRDRRCGCSTDQTIGRYSEDGTLFWCCPNCPAGTEAQKQCSFTNFATPCSACPPGTFSGGLGAPCRNCTRCGDMEKSPCTNTRDAVCIAVESGPDGSANGTVIILTAALAGCLLLSAAAAVLMILQRRRASIAKTNLPPSPGASSSLEGRTRGSSPTLQHEEDLENPLVPIKCDALSISSSVSSGIEGVMSASVSEYEA